MKLIKLVAVTLIIAHASQINAAVEAEHKTIETVVYVAWQGKPGHPNGYHDITVPVDRDRVRVSAVAIKAALSKKHNHDFSTYNVLFRHDLVADQALSCLDDSILAKDLKKNDTKIDYPTVFTMTPEIQRRYETAQKAREISRYTKAGLMDVILNGHLAKSAPTAVSWSPGSSSSSSCSSSSSSSSTPFAMTFRSGSSSSSSSVPMVTSLDDVD